MSMLIIATQILIILFAELYLMEKFLYSHYKQKHLDCPYYFPQENFVFEEVFTELEQPTAALDSSMVLAHSDIEGTEAESLFQELVSEISVTSDDDGLSLADWVYEEEEVIPTVLGSTKISDNKEGLQNWMVSVVGIEREYVHVSDGTRIWLDLIDFAREVQHGDILSLQVNRMKDCVEVVEVLDIQRLQHQEYCIPDEAAYYWYDDEIEIAEAI
ncbi:hypothetical protein M3936_19700 [Sutcliffiella horikoshii]|uniref:hypothetical protein n=1 Tax=Sutcliffiella horikoshii TaxID=79883 RepID=UPI00203E6094|nr:hypothetical protein [Sutcliffiella horikoshii]MCM3619800.1 hypothetical protein [Sutcliffiella horikoshii]